MHPPVRAWAVLKEFAERKERVFYLEPQTCETIHEINWNPFENFTSLFTSGVVVSRCEKGGSYCETAPQSTSTIEASQGSGKPASGGATSGASAQDPSSAPSHDSHSHCLAVMM